MERRFAVHAGAHRQALILAIVLAGAPAVAAPTSPDAKTQFDRGVAAYQHGDFSAASEAFERSNAIESDVETLFAWAQAERKLSRCDKAVELYGKLLAMDLPVENQHAIKVQLSECKQILAAQQPVEPVPPARTEPEHVAPQPEPAIEDQRRPWYRDPIGDALVGVGVIGVGVGVAMIVSGHAASRDELGAPTYQAFEVLDDKARSRGDLGVIATGAGLACLAGGIAWYATHGNHPRDKTLTAWLAPSGGGLAITGGF